MVGKKLYTTLKKRKSKYRNQKSQASLIAKGITDLCLQFIRKDHDGQYIIDYLSPYYNIDNDDFGRWFKKSMLDSYRAIIKEYEVVCSELFQDRFRENETEYKRIQKKYKYLIDYYEKNLQNWRLTIPQKD